jgi:hypothetical protein
MYQKPPKDSMFLAFSLKIAPLFFIALRTPPKSSQMCRLAADVDWAESIFSDCLMNSWAGVGLVTEIVVGSSEEDWQSRCLDLQ